MTKICPKCKTEKFLSDFGKSIHTKSGKTSWCLNCSSAATRKRYSQNKETFEWKKKSRLRDKIRKRTPERSKYLKDYAANPVTKERMKENHLIKTYEITLTQYKDIVLKQNKMCLICEKTAEEATPSTPRLYVDHDHITKKIRGLLCQKCNSMLGLCRDSVEILEKAIEYLKSNNYYLTTLIGD